MDDAGQRKVNRLRDRSVRTVKPKAKIRDYRDENGLLLRVRPNGRKQWIWRGTIRGSGKESMFGLGTPDYVTLAEARDTARTYRRLARQGRDPRGSRSQGITFLEAAHRKHAELAPTFKSAKASTQWISRIERICGPVFGSRPISDVSPADVRKAFLAVWQQTPDAASRARQATQKVFEWAIASDLRLDNPATLERLALPAQATVEKHHPSLPYDKMPGFLTQLREASAKETTKQCFEFLILTATRSSEARGARWEEVDFDTQTWTIPGGRTGRMKGRNPPDHIVPLSDAAMAILKKFAKDTARAKGLIFVGSGDKLLSENAFSPMLNSLGLKGKATLHGMRASFKTWATNEGANERDVAEFCLAHQVESKVERAYLRETMFEQRIELMQRWADFIHSDTDTSKKNNN